MATKKAVSVKDEITIAFRVMYLPLHYDRKQWIFLLELLK